jgi:hypothetical protein
MFAEEKPFLQPLPLEPFRYYQYGERTVHLDSRVEWKRVTTERRRAGSGARSRSSGTRCSCVCLIPARVSCYVNTWAASVALVVSATRIVHVVRRPDCFNCWHVGTRQEPTSALSVTPSMLARANSECAASKVFSNWLAIRRSSFR